MMSSSGLLEVIWRGGFASASEKLRSPHVRFGSKAVVRARSGQGPLWVERGNDNLSALAMISQPRDSAGAGQLSQLAVVH
jgi:hypothetical protein